MEEVYKRSQGLEKACDYPGGAFIPSAVFATLSHHKSLIHTVVLVQCLAAPVLVINGVLVMGNRLQRKQAFNCCYPAPPWESSSRAG